MPRKAIQKLRIAVEENFDELKTDVDETLAHELHFCGQQEACNCSLDVSSSIVIFDFIQKVVWGVVVHDFLNYRKNYYSVCVD